MPSSSSISHSRTRFQGLPVPRRTTQSYDTRNILVCFSKSTSLMLSHWSLEVVTVASVILASITEYLRYGKL